MAARDYILHNFWWKLLSLLLAALTWLTIETAFKKEEARRESPPVVTTSTVTFPTVPITLLMPTTNTSHFTVNPTTVSVEVTGESNQLDTLRIQDIKVFVDVSGAGDQKEFRRPIQAQLPYGIKVANLNPTNASVDRITSAQ